MPVCTAVCVSVCVSMCERGRPHGRLVIGRFAIDRPLRWPEATPPPNGTKRNETEGLSNARHDSGPLLLLALIGCRPPPPFITRLLLFPDFVTTVGFGVTASFFNVPFQRRALLFSTHHTAQSPSRGINIAG